MSKLLKSLKNEETKSLILRLPISLSNVIENYQEASKNRHGNKLSKHDAAIYMLVIGVASMQKETENMVAEFVEYNS